MNLKDEFLKSDSGQTPAFARRRCPECGAAMVEVDRVKENGGFFIWYECTKKGCDGAWLENTKSD